MKNIIKVLICLAFSLGIVFGLPQVLHVLGDESVDYINEASAIQQSILSHSTTPQDYYKMYDGSKLIGVVTDKEYIENAIIQKGKDSAINLQDSEFGLKSSVYMTPEKSYNVFENIDDEIINYIANNQLLGIKTTSVEFSTEEGIYDIIYVKDIEDFYEARDEFISNFVSSDTLKAIREKQKIADITEFGTVEKDAYILETISYGSAVVSPTEIFDSEEKIYEYLCYGRNTDREYYSIQEGDTLAGIGYKFGNLSPKQVVSLNKNVLTSVDQILKTGLSINVSYFTSPITVVVTKQRLAQETITPENPEYIRDTSMNAGEVLIEEKEVIGLKNVLYEERWVNGVLTSGEKKSDVVVKEPHRGIIRIGIGATYQLGTGNFIFPTENPRISCGYACYVMNGQIHNGTDIVNMYNPWGPVYAADSGTVEKVSYDDVSGNFVVINHNNGSKTYYGHLNKPAFVDVGQAVVRGQLIGQIGMTGLATGPHIHFMIYLEDTPGNFSVKNVCTIMDCSPIS